MKQLIAAALALLAFAPAQAADERERIRAERAAVQARHAEQEKACRATFAVTDCVQRVQRERNAALAALRAQERVLNDAERRQRAAERQRDLDERNSPERRQEAEARRRQALIDQQDRADRAAEKARRRAEEDAQKAQRGPRQPKAAGGAPGPQGTPRAPHAPKSHALSAEEAAKNRAAYEERLKKAEAHNQELRERQARRRKPAASDLPIPQ
jgi:colicin import membrane protein